MSNWEKMAWGLPLLAALLLGGHIWQRQERPLDRQLARARNDLRTLNMALQGRQTALPSTAQGLTALDIAPPRDPWGRPYRYRNPGKMRSYDLYSLGPDGVDSDDDVVLWDLYRRR